MKIHSLTFIVLYFIYSHAVFAIDPVYEGEDGIRANVFATNCLACHSSGLTGAQRNGAPSNVNWDTFSAAVENADRAIVRAVDQMTMPPSFFGLPALDQEQKDAMLAWQQAGFPESQTTDPGNQTNATYDVATQILALPVVIVDELTYGVTLKLISLPGSTFGFGFSLDTAELNEETSTTAAIYTPATGVLEVPLINLLNSGESSNPVSAEMLLIPNTTPIQFEVTLVETIN